jgi:hypothetical protein
VQTISICVDPVELRRIGLDSADKGEGFLCPRIFDVEPGKWVSFGEDAIVGVCGVEIELE